MWWRNLTVRHAHGLLSRRSSSYYKNSTNDITWWSVCSSVTSYSDDAPIKKGKLAPLQERRMIDRFRVWAKGGEGGNGCCSFRRTRTDRRGKPDGGNGGRGGDVFVECSQAVWDFSGLQHHVNAKRGGHGISKNQIGTRGSDKVVHVPIGTVIHLVSGETPSFIEDKSTSSLNPWDIPISSDEELQTNPENVSNEISNPPELLTNRAEECISSEKETELGLETETEIEEIKYSIAELTIPGQRLLIARGGEGGLGNASLPKDHKFQDKTDNNCDTGFNIGKSTLLGALSRAQPAVGDYAFTTLRPNIGNLTYSDFFSVKVADIPGLIEGAHENRGLGHAFLRHIERTSILAYVVDLSAELNFRKGISPWQQLRDLVVELECYKEGLSEKPSLVVANKIDEEGSDLVLEELKKRICGVDIYPVCAILGEGVDDVKEGIRKLMDGRDCRSLNLSNIKVD